MWVLLIDLSRGNPCSLAHRLETSGHTVELISKWTRGLARASAQEHDMILFVDHKKEVHSDTELSKLALIAPALPVISIVPANTFENVIRALDAGADDVLVDPFDFEELLARMRAICSRRRYGTMRDNLCIGMISIDLSRREVLINGGASISLRRKEYDVFSLLVRRKETVVTRSVLAEAVWGDILNVSDDTLNSTISSLRKMLRSAQSQTPRAPVRIVTIPGVGYMLTKTARKPRAQNGLGVSNNL